jgi:acetyltransferase-like isoleucine patch superfamily enzyme
MSTAWENNVVGESPFSTIQRIRTKLHGAWLRHTYPFAEFGTGVSVHSSCDIWRSMSRQIRIGDNVYLAPEVWIDVACDSADTEPRVVIGSGCAIGRRSTISASNRIVLEPDVLLAPSVLITDHYRDSSKTDASDDAPSVAEGGEISIGRNCWLGIGAVIACGSGKLTLGRNCVVGANAVVTRSFPPFSVIAGNPAKLVKMYDEQSAKWVKPNAKHA